MPAATVSAPPGARRVLVIDDEPAVLRVIGLLLERHGFAVASATNAREGLSMLADKGFDVVLSDIIMPELSGLDFLKELRQHDLDVPVILMTAGATLDSALDAIEYGISAKWPEILKQIAPSVTRAAVLRDATSRAGIGQFGALQSVAPSFGLELTPVGLGDTEIERGIKKFVGAGKGGLIVTASQLAALHCELIVSLAAEHKLPAVYSDEYFVTRDGLASYGPDRVAIYPLAAGYVQRILMGEKPANLPVQAPTKYELAINLKTAKTLGLDVPTSLLARANEVIE